MGIEKRVDELRLNYVLEIPTDGTRFSVWYENNPKPDSRFNDPTPKKEYLHLAFERRNLDWREPLMRKDFPWNPVVEVYVTEDGWKITNGSKREFKLEEITATDFNPELMRQMRKIEDVRIQRAAEKLIPGYMQKREAYVPAVSGR